MLWPHVSVKHALKGYQAMRKPQAWCWALLRPVHALCAWPCPTASLVIHL